MESRRFQPDHCGALPGPESAWRRFGNGVHRITVNGHTGQVHVKTNYGGSGITPSKVANNRAKYLGPITVMFQREKGYDRDNANWFWAKYTPDGGLDKNPKGMQLAGRVAKGMDSGCIGCHNAAQGDDLLFTNDARQIDK